jgi:nitrogen fixation/metabolism regulation signal transduction histidine kinase
MTKTAVVSGRSCTARFKGASFDLLQIGILQLLPSLCINARDPIAGVGKVTIETENTVFGEAYCADYSGFICGEYVVLGVSDDGCGMDKDAMNHHFEPFFTTKEVGKGTRLGPATYDVA